MCDGMPGSWIRQNGVHPFEMLEQQPRTYPSASKSGFWIRLPV